MSNEEIVKQIQQENNTSDNMELLYLQNRNYLYKIAKKYSFMDDMDDLMQEAYFGLYEAVQRYEDTGETKFMTYAAFWIKQSIVRYLENNSRAVRIPNGLQAKVLSYKKAISAYEMQLGRKPTDYELCRYLGISSVALNAVKKASFQYDNMQSLDEPLPGTEDILIGDGVPDKNADIENNIVDGMIERSLRSDLWQIVKDNTSPEENAVIRARYIDSMTLEATSQSIGQTRDKARAIEAKAIRKLRHSRIRRQLEEKFEVNYARVYRGSFSEFKYTGTSIVEDIAIRNIDAVNDTYTKIVSRN